MINLRKQQGVITLKSKKIKEKIYNETVSFGINTLRTIFPEYFAKEPLAPTDRYIEYPFAIRNLPKPPVKILDVGCAGSFFPLLLASFGYETYGIDIREYAIINKIKFDNFRFVREDITKKTSFPDNCFGVITAISTLEHIGIAGRHGVTQMDLSGDKNAIKEIKRILKSNGILIITIPFGIAKIIKRYCRIYDNTLVKQLVKGLEIEEEVYYMQDSNDDWYKCSKRQAEGVNAKNDRYPLCLLKIVKR